MTEMSGATREAPVNRELRRRRTTLRTRFRCSLGGVVMSNRCTLSRESRVWKEGSQKAHRQSESSDELCLAGLDWNNEGVV